MQSKVNVELVSQAVQGSREAWGQLYTDYAKYVHDVANLKLRNHADADEVCQDVFLFGWRKIGQLRKPEAFGGWLRQIISRCVVNRKTRYSDENTNQEAVALDTVATGPTGQDTDYGVTGQRLREVVANLDECYRVTAERHYFNCEKIKRIASDLNLPLGTVKRRLNVARAKIRKELVAA